MVVSHVSAVVLHAVRVGAAARRGPRDPAGPAGGRTGAGVVQHRGRSAPGRGGAGRTRGRPARPVRRWTWSGSSASSTRCPCSTTSCAAARRHARSWSAAGAGWTPGPARLSADLAVRLADGRRESVGESRTAYCFYLGGVPQARSSQWRVLDERGAEIARLDFAWPGRGLGRVRRQGEVPQAPASG